MQALRWWGRRERSDCRRSLVTAFYFTVRSSYPTPKAKEGAPHTGERRPGRPKYEVAKLSWMPGKKIQAFRHFEFCKHCREKGHSYHWSIAKLYFIAQPGWQAFVREGEGNLRARPRAMDWLSRLSPEFRFPSFSNICHAGYSSPDFDRISWNGIFFISISILFCNYYFHSFLKVLLIAELPRAQSARTAEHHG